MTVEPMTDTEFAAFCARAYRCDARIGTVVLRRDEAERLLARFEAICDGAIAERARADAAEAERDEQKAIITRIWAQFGSPTYEELAGRSIYDLIDGLRAERDAAVARAMPEPRLMRTVEEVEALPDGNYAYCFAQGKRLRGLATKRNRVWTFIGTDDECEPNSAEMVATWISGPLPDLPIPTAAQEG